ncbi:MAG: hydrogenase [Spirochaetes bacterium GWF1_31_7]|nr:MAG: hydrogenase [Spirochaetes bacterium GWE1_32_154]OHD46116.1 MAG: hydrogenase [Spirochaetes bacterium GWE2_31_10]OHD47515.1 MAG: hydrogenase [Spirochaetes bacterium GWF1_31_7]
MAAINHTFTPINNTSAIPLEKIPVLAVDDFMQSILKSVQKSHRISSYFGVATDKIDTTLLYVILSDDDENRLFVGRTEITGGSFPSLTALCPQIHLFEREIAEQFGLQPIGHPWLKPVRYTRNKTSPVEPAVGDFYRIDGDQIHEVAVGPVHAGIIEPGHFRFQCNGEKVLHLEIALGFQHRGIEEALIGGPDKKTIHYMETAAGDTTIGHTTTYCQIIEALSHTKKTARAQVLSGIALELERLANHIGDLGALSGDVGFLPTASFCGRIRGDFLNCTGLLCGNRFGRGFIKPSGLGSDIDSTTVDTLLKKIIVLTKETKDAISLLWSNQSVMARFEDTGLLTGQQAIELGVVGVAARASGLSRDARLNHPSGVFRFFQMHTCTVDSGDVFARAYIRWLEIEQSIDFIIKQLTSLPDGSVTPSSNDLDKNCLSVAINEGWRGEICHVAITGENGQFVRYKIVDPSFHNWYALAEAVKNQEISDFPLCNKSFNLSYCGHDL